MAVVAISDSILTDIADAIRSKNGTENTYKPAQMPDAIEAISGGGITPTGTKEITSNGTGIDVASYAYADVAVPNSYAAGDEGKVVSNGALVSQTSDTVTSNDTYDTTLINSLTVNVSGGSSPTSLELANLGWEVGAVDGGTGQQYQNKKLNNTARLRGIYLVSTANIPFNLSANWGNGEWTIMVAQYGSDGLGKTQFTTVLTSDGQLPISPYLAFVIRHSDGTTAMNVSDINTINPILTIDSSRLS